MLIHIFLLLLCGPANKPVPDDLKALVGSYCSAAPSDLMINGEHVRRISALWQTAFSEGLVEKCTWWGSGTNVTILQRGLLWEKGRKGNESKTYRAGETVATCNGFVLSRWSKKYWIFWSSNAKSLHYLVFAFWCLQIGFLLSFCFSILNYTRHCLSITTYWDIMRLAIALFKLGLFLVPHTASRSPLPLLTNNCQTLNKT